MRVYRSDDIAAWSKPFRTHFVNCLSGAKGANLIGTRSEDGHDNLALFSSVVHLGANPPLLGFVMRPVHVERHTYDNIIATGFFTVNAVANDMRAEAHHTSAHFPKGKSEFEACGFVAAYVENFHAPFVQGPLGIGCTLEDDMEIKANGTRFIIGRIAMVVVDETIVRSDGYLDLASAGVAAITGTDSYHALLPGVRYASAKTDQPVTTLLP